MKKECMELFKNDVIDEVSIYDRNYNAIILLHEKTIEEIADEIVEILKHIDDCIYESDTMTLFFKEPNKEDIVKTLILNEVNYLMRDTLWYKEDDSRTHLWDRITECTGFMTKNKDVSTMTLIHKESFLCDEEFSIEIFNVISEMTFSIKVIENTYDIQDADDTMEWDKIWNEVYRMVVAQ